MNKIISKFVIGIIGIMITLIGSSLGIKLGIGVVAWDALAQSISSVLKMKVGTVSMILNISCVIIQLLILRKEFEIKHLAQVFISIISGSVVNFMLYGFFSNIIIDNYFIKLLLFLVSVIISAIGISMITAINFFSFPLESCCMVISKKINKNFGCVRQMADIVSIIISLVIAITFRNSMTIREGTVIAMIIFGPILNLFIRIISPELDKLSIVD